MRFLCNIYLNFYFAAPHGDQGSERPNTLVPSTHADQLDYSLTDIAATPIELIDETDIDFNMIIHDRLDSPSRPVSSSSPAYQPDLSYQPGPSYQLSQLNEPGQSSSSTYQPAPLYQSDSDSDLEDHFTFKPFGTWNRKVILKGKKPFYTYTYTQFI